MTDLRGLDAGELLRRLRGREITSLGLTERYLERIRAMDRSIGAFVRVNPTARDEARRSDGRLDAGEGGPLEGLPVAVKDNLVIAGMETSCGSRILERFVPTGDAAAVERLRRAGAVVLGKTNLDEFAMGSSTENSALGPTRNPWDLDRVPGGSSGGSAAAVAAGMAAAAVGSSTGGSVRQPAAFCGVVGLKPTYGRVSRWGLVAFGSSLDVVGPLAASVEDAARLLDVMAGPDPRDSTSATAPPGKYRASCGSGARGLHVGVPGEYLTGGVDRAIRDAVGNAAGALEVAGARVDEISLPHTRYAVPTYCLVATAEASSNLARYDGVRFGMRWDVPGGLDRTYAATRGKGFGPEVRRRIMLGTFALSAGYREAYYGRAMKTRTLIRRDFEERFREGVDLVLAPTTPTPAFRIGEKADDPLAMYLCDIFTATANLAGLPAISVPAGRSEEGLPVGVQLIGPDFAEERLLAGAAVIEARFGRLTPPALPGEALSSPGDR